MRGPTTGTRGDTPRTARGCPGLAARTRRRRRRPAGSPPPRRLRDSRPPRSPRPGRPPRAGEPTRRTARRADRDESAAARGLVGVAALPPPTREGVVARRELAAPVALHQQD